MFPNTIMTKQKKKKQCLAESKRSAEDDERRRYRTCEAASGKTLDKTESSCLKNCKCICTYGPGTKAEPEKEKSHFAKEIMSPSYDVIPFPPNLL